MKRESRIGKSQVINISENGIVTIPSETKMSISEIADLFGIYYQTARKHIRSIEKSGIVKGNKFSEASVEGMTIYPEYYGLEMLIALSFNIKTNKAETFRKWIVDKLKANSTLKTIFVIKDWNNSLLN